MSNDPPISFIVTRPKDREKQLVEALTEQCRQFSNVQIIHCPLITIEPYSEPQELNETRFDGVIFISINAVEYAKTLENWPDILINPLYAIGKQTANYLKNLLPQQQDRQTVSYPPQMNTEGFLALETVQNIAGQSWLIVKGLDGREILKRGLEAAGAKVTELRVYQRKLPDLLAQRQIASYNQLNPIWIVTSTQALTHLHRILGKREKACRVIVSSERIKTEAIKLGFNPVAVAENATDGSLIDCVQQVYQEII